MISKEPLMSLTYHSMWTIELLSYSSATEEKFIYQFVYIT